MPGGGKRKFCRVAGRFPRFRFFRNQVSRIHFVLVTIVCSRDRFEVVVCLLCLVALCCCVRSCFPFAYVYVFRVEVFLWLFFIYVRFFVF